MKSRRKSRSQKCVCGKYVSESMDDHYLSEYHQEYVQKLFKKCYICYNTHSSTIFHTCSKCSNSVCFECIHGMKKTGRSLKCPFCRTHLWY